MAWIFPENSSPLQDTWRLDNDISVKEPLPICVMHTLNNSPMLGYWKPNLEIVQPPPVAVFNTKPNSYPMFPEWKVSILGAFANSKIRSVQLPTTVKTLGDHTAYNSKIRRIKIPKDCTYNENTTFPPDCIVERMNS